VTATREAVVVDASIVVALVASPSSVADDIARRISPAALHAPATLPVEVDSALRGLALGRRLTVAQADAARQIAHGLPVELWPWHPLADRAWQLRENLSTYDAGYVALTEHLSAVLITGDARIARAAGTTCRVEVFR
jgi:predicted nucleic acid-binding protein